MTPKKLVPIIVKALRETQRPWGRKDLWLAEMVIGAVEERAKRIHFSAEETILFDNCVEKERDVQDAYRELGLLERDWTWLKGKVEG